VNVAITVPVHNALDYTRRSLEQIRKTVPQGVPLVLVEDACDEETSDFLYHYRADRLSQDDEKREVTEERPITLLSNSEQQLYTRSANRGIRYAYHHYKADVILVVNTDCDLRQGWYEGLLGGISLLPQVGIVGFRDNSTGGGPYTTIRYPDYITGHCMAYRVKMLEEIGILCETDLTGKADRVLAPYLGQAHIGSERIHCWKAMAAGWQAMYCNAPVVFHEGGKSWGHRLDWLSRFELKPGWHPCDTLDKPEWVYDPSWDAYPTFPHPLLVD
jgi:GT2 family glycosyltransferase